MRIIGGKYRGKKLIVPNNRHIRPTKDIFKETLFNILEHNYKKQLQGNVLDLFAGSGSLGLECLSRDCLNVVFVDICPNAISLIKRNLINMPELERCKFICANSTNVELQSLNLKFSLIFLDPPYDSELILKSLQHLLKQQVLSKNCCLIMETNKELILPNVQLYQQKKIGKSWLKIYKLIIN